MKNITSSLLCCLLALITLNSCQQDITPAPNTDQELKNQYMVNWIKRYGLIDPEHDWNVAKSVTAGIDPESFGAGSRVDVYNRDPRKGGALMARMTITADLQINVYKDATDVYVEVYNADGSRVATGLCPVEGDHIAINADTLAPAKAMSRAGEDDVEVPVSLRGNYQYILACEDLGGSFDEDFNDVVIGINSWNVDEQKFVAVTALAAGGVFPADVMLGDDKLFEIHTAGFGQTKVDIYNPAVFAHPGCTEIRKVKSFDIADGNLGGLKVKVNFGENAVKEAVLAARPLGESPQILCLPGSWQWPTENTPIEVAYEGFTSWNSDHTDLTWADTPVTGKYVVRTSGGSTTPTTQTNVHTSAPELREVDATVTYTKPNDQGGQVTLQRRPYMIYLPSDIQDNAPVLFSLHGANGQMGSYEPITVDDAEILGECIVVWPNGVYQPMQGSQITGWDASGQSNADLEYFKAIIADLKANYSINENRIYCCGFSNGGMMTYSMANCAYDVFAAFASISGFQMNEFHHQYYYPFTVPFLHIHGMADHFVKYEFVKIIRDNMVARNGCNPNGNVETIGNSRKITYAKGSTDQSDVPYIFYEIDGMAHWSRVDNIGGKSSSQIIWDFVSQYALGRAKNETLKWRYNPDVTYNHEPNCGHTMTIEAVMDHGWKLTDSYRGLTWGTKTAPDEILYWDGEGNSSESKTAWNYQSAIEAKVYRAIQLTPGNYRFKFKTTADGSNTYTIQLTEQGTGTSVMYLRATAGTEGYMPFTVPANAAQPYREYQIKLLKEGESSNYTFQTFEIVTGQSGDTPVNCSTVTPADPEEVLIPFMDGNYGKVANTNQGRAAANQENEYVEFTTSNAFSFAFNLVNGTDYDMTGYTSVKVVFDENPEGWLMTANGQQGMASVTGTMWTYTGVPSEITLISGGEITNDKPAKVVGVYKCK